MTTEKRQLPTIRQLHSDIEKFEKQDSLNYLCNQEPRKEWIKSNSQANNSQYLTIGTVEYLLQKIFKGFRVEVLREGALFNSVYCCVRLHLTSPIDGKDMFYDGVGAVELQTKKDSGALKPDFSNINRMAVMMALPMAKSYAIKDAAEHIGKLFGRDLNRKDVLEYVPEKSINDKADAKELNRIGEHIQSLTNVNDLELFGNANPEWKSACELRIKSLTNGK